jgi:transcriptional regulator with XRE-family HTH domain
MELGLKIKQQRKELGLSLRDLAERVDLTASFLSQIERDIASPSIESLRKISRALNVPVFYFLFEKDGPSPVVRHDQRRQMSLPNSSINYQLLTPNAERKLELIMGEIDPADGEIPLIHYQQTEECIFVLEGQLEVTLGAETYLLQKGDTVYFDGPMLQRMIARGDQVVRYLSAITPPIF